MSDQDFEDGRQVSTFANTFRYRGREVQLCSWVNKHDGCQLTNFTIDDKTVYPYPHRSREAAIEKAKQIIDAEFWDWVRAGLARQAARWNRGSEGRLMFENLVEHEDWQERLQDLAGDPGDLEPSQIVAIIITNYFCQSISVPKD